jgi:hypothetical protein
VGRLAPLLFMVPFFAFWETMALKIPKDSLFGIAFPVFGLVVMCLILAQTCGDVIWSMYTRGRTYYALTADGYAVIFTDMIGGMTKRIYLPSVSTIGLEAKADGSGSITFGEAQTTSWWMNNRYSTLRPPAFDFVRDASKVYDLCMKLQQGKTA